MLGVVLWHDQESNRALIWCEDQGDLAYFNGTEDFKSREFAQLGEGDLVRFDVSEGHNRRYASNPMPVDRGQYASLPDILRQNGRDTGLQGHAGEDTNTRVSKPVAKRRGSNVVPFPTNEYALAAVE